MNFPQYEHVQWTPRGEEQDPDSGGETLRAALWTWILELMNLEAWAVLKIVCIMSLLIII